MKDDNLLFMLELLLTMVLPVGMALIIMTYNLVPGCILLVLLLIGLYLRYRELIK